jgi:hypothetical protein
MEMRPAVEECLAKNNVVTLFLHSIISDIRSGFEYGAISLCKRSS